MAPPIPPPSWPPSPIPPPSGGDKDQAIANAEQAGQALDKILEELHQSLTPENEIAIAGNLENFGTNLKEAFSHLPLSKQTAGEADEANALFHLFSKAQEAIGNYFKTGTGESQDAALQHITSLKEELGKWIDSLKNSP